MASNIDVAVMAKKIYELSTLTPDELEARTWEAFLIINAVISSATPAGIDKMNVDKEARWGDQIRKEGLMSALKPKWFLRSDDSKPPIIKIALESALDNPNRDMRTRLQALMFIPPEEREPLTDLVRALAAEAFDGSTSEGKEKYFSVVRPLSATWFKEPWITIFPPDGQPPPLLILIDNQGETHDGGIYDDPSDDTAWEKVKFGWEDAIRTWDVDFLRDNPLAQFYLKADEVASGAVDAATTAAGTATEVAKAANSLLMGLAKAIQYWPYAAAGVAAVVVIVVTRD